MGRVELSCKSQGVLVPSVGFSRGRAKAHGSLEVWWDCGPSSGWAVRLNQPMKDDRYVHILKSGKF